MIDVELRRLLIDQRLDEHAVYLQEVGGERGFPIAVGIFEATVLDRIVKGRTSPRPLTHSLLLSVMHRLGGTLTAVEIDGQEDDCYLAKLVVAGSGDEARIDCRPSDGIALALQTGAPIRVEPGLLDAAAL